MLCFIPNHFKYLRNYCADVLYYFRVIKIQIFKYDAHIFLRMGDSENNKRILENISMFGLGDLSEESRKELEYGLEHKLFTRIDVGAAQIKYMASEFWDMYNESTLAEKIGI